MLKILKQTKEEKMSMYLKLSKKQLAEMLINCNDIITILTQEKNCVTPKEVEKDYEILSVTSNVFPTNIFYRNKQNFNEYLKDDNPHIIYTLDYIIENLNKDIKIHSIKRLSDGEVITIGDKVSSTISDLGRPTDLTGFKLDNNKISLGLKIGLRGIGYYPLNTIIKYKKPIEKDYEILSFKFQNNIYTKKFNGLYTDCQTYILENPEKTEIYSVKRLSDGEVFTIGDKVTCQDCIGEIKSFFICGTINIEGVGTKDNPNMPWSFPLTELWDDMIELPQKVKKPLFTTEDGIDIYEGDEHYSVNITTFDLIKTKRITPPIDNDKRFSRKEKAEEFILMNKPCLSVRDILKRFNSRWSEVNDTTLKELVRSKI